MSVSTSKELTTYAALRRWITSSLVAVLNTVDCRDFVANTQVTFQKPRHAVAHPCRRKLGWPVSTAFRSYALVKSRNLLDSTGCQRQHQRGHQCVDRTYWNLWTRGWMLHASPYTKEGLPADHSDTLQGRITTSLTAIKQFDDSWYRWLSKPIVVKDSCED